MRILPVTRGTRFALATVAVVAAVLVAWCWVVSSDVRYRGRTASWWAEELERGPDRDYVSCGPLPFTETLPAPIRRLIPVRYDPEGFALQLGDPAAIPVLLALLRDPHPKTRAFAAIGLAAINRPSRDVVDALVGALEDEDLEARSAVADALRTINPEVAERVDMKQLGPRN
jgi:HEAT repeat protein